MEKKTIAVRERNWYQTITAARQIRKLPSVMERVENVRKFRQSSKKNLLRRVQILRHCFKKLDILQVSIFLFRVTRLKIDVIFRLDSFHLTLS